MSICESEVMERGKVEWNTYTLGGDGRPVSNRTVLTCPECDQDALVVKDSCRLPNGNVWRKRICRYCGYVADREEKTVIVKEL